MLSSPPTASTTVLITADQCSRRNTALVGCDLASTVVVMIESLLELRRPRLHKRKIVLLLSVMRHFAADLERAGWTVDYYREQESVQAAFAQHVARFRPMHVRMMQQSEWGQTEAWCAIARTAGLATDVTPHCNFISTPADFDALQKTPSSRVTLDIFYRRMRQTTGLLMDGTHPAGGAWNYDADNRKPPRAGLRFTPAPRFEPDAITADVIATVEQRFAAHPGLVGDFAIAVTYADASTLLEHFCTQRLRTFGPWQDAMLAGERTMSHSLLSAAINTGLLHPLEVCARAESAYRDGTAPLASVEGFIRQIIGWREYIWRVYWKMMPAYRERNALEANLPLPAFYWTGETNMSCMRDALAHVRETAYAHHILRLMVLGNFALIAGCDPVATNDWFWAMFIDGYDWVMVPNVIGMALHADGGYVGTKPYAASANYINTMSNYCGTCRYDRKAIDTDDACPFNALYWDFIARNEARFERNPRMSVIVRNWQRRAPTWQAAVREKAERTREALRSGGDI